MPLFKDVAQGAEHLLPTAKRILASLKETLGKITNVVQKRVYVSTGEQIHVRAVLAGQQWFDYIRIEAKNLVPPVAYTLGAFDYLTKTTYTLGDFDERYIGISVSTTDSPALRFSVTAVGSSPPLGNTSSVAIDAAASVAYPDYKRPELVDFALSLGWGSMIWAVVDRCYPIRGSGYHLCHIRKVSEDGSTRTKMLFRSGATGNSFFVGYLDEFEALRSAPGPWDFTTLLQSVSSPIPTAISSKPYSVNFVFDENLFSNKNPEFDLDYAAWAWYDIYPSFGVMGAYSDVVDSGSTGLTGDRHYFIVRLAADGQLEYVQDNGITPFTDLFTSLPPSSFPFSWGDYSIPRVGLDRSVLESVVYAAEGTHFAGDGYRAAGNLQDFSPGPSGGGLDTPFSGNFVVSRTNVSGKSETITYKFFGESVASATFNTPYPLGIVQGDTVDTFSPTVRQAEDHLQPTTQFGFAEFGAFSSSPNYRFSWREPRPLSTSHICLFDPRSDRYFYASVSSVGAYTGAVTTYLSDPTDANAAAAMAYVTTLFNNFASPDVILRLGKPGSAVLLARP